MTRSERKLRVRIGRNLRRLRTLHMFTQQKLAEISGLHWRHIQKIEKGEVNVTLQTITRCADALQVDAGALFNDMDSKIVSEPRAGAMQCRAPVSLQS